MQIVLIKNLNIKYQIDGFSLQNNKYKQLVNKVFNKMIIHKSYSLFI